MAVASALWHWRDAVLAIVLAIAYGLVLATTPGADAGTAAPVAEGVPVEITAARMLAAFFLLSLAIRIRAPLVPLALAFPPLLLAGRGAIEGSLILSAGLLLACYSVGAWTGGRPAAVGGFGVGALVGMVVLRAPATPPATRDIATALLLLGGAWLFGLAVRQVRIARGHPRLAGAGDGQAVADGSALAPEHADVARDIRDVIERSLAVVVLQARAGLRHLDADPERARHALDIIETTGTEAIADTRRLVGELLAPGSGATASPSPSLSDLDQLAVHVTDAGLPVDLRVEGRPVPLQPEVEALAFRVVQEALINALEHAGPARASVVVRFEPDELTLDISDDGAGVTGDTDGGLANLLEIRGAVTALGGTLEAGPRDRRGYRVEVRLPVAADW